MPSIQAGKQYHYSLLIYMCGLKLSNNARTVQRNFLVPRDACRVKRDMSGIIRSGESDTTLRSMEIELAWAVDNVAQDAITDERVQELPSGLFLLDEYQERIAQTPPPLLLESRSGMGKTEILFKHSLFYEPEKRKGSRTCFVTVSAHLSRALQRRYDEVQEIQQVTLPPVSFFSFFGSQVRTERGAERVRSFVDLLLRKCGVVDAMSVVTGTSCYFPLCVERFPFISNPFPQPAAFICTSMSELRTRGYTWIPR